MTRASWTGGFSAVAERAGGETSLERGPGDREERARDREGERDVAGGASHGAGARARRDGDASERRAASGGSSAAAVWLHECLRGWSDRWSLRERETLYLLLLSASEIFLRASF